MIQTGDPTGTGKGGQSIWGKKFEDEVRDDLKVRVCLNLQGDGVVEFYWPAVNHLKRRVLEYVLG